MQHFLPTYGKKNFKGKYTINKAQQELYSIAIGMRVRRQTLCSTEGKAYRVVVITVVLGSLAT